MRLLGAAECDYPILYRGSRLIHWTNCQFAVGCPLRQGSMARPVAVLEMTAEERAAPERRVRSTTTPQRDVLRERIVLLCGEGSTRRETARRLIVSLPRVNRWSQRFGRNGLPGLLDKRGRGRKRSIPDQTVKRVIEMAGQAPPGRRRWSTKTAAAKVGISFPQRVAHLAVPRAQTAGDAHLQGIEGIWSSRPSSGT